MLDSALCAFHTTCYLQIGVASLREDDEDSSSVSKLAFPLEFANLSVYITVIAAGVTSGLFLCQGFDPEHSDLFRMLRTGLGALSENLDTVDIWIMCGLCGFYQSCVYRVLPRQQAHAALSS